MLLLAISGGKRCLANRQMLIESRKHRGFARVLAHDRYQVHQVTLAENLDDTCVRWGSDNVFRE